MKRKIIIILFFLHNIERPQLRTGHDFTSVSEERLKAREGKFKDYWFHTIALVKIFPFVRESILLEQNIDPSSTKGPSMRSEVRGVRTHKGLGFTDENMSTPKYFDS